MRNVAEKVLIKVACLGVVLFIIAVSGGLVAIGVDSIIDGEVFWGIFNIALGFICIGGSGAHMLGVAREERGHGN